MIVASQRITSIKQKNKEYTFRQLTRNAYPFITFHLHLALFYAIKTHSCRLSSVLLSLIQLVQVILFLHGLYIDYANYITFEFKSLYIDYIYL